MGALCSKGLDAHHATGSKAFTGNMRKIVGSRAGVQFKFFNNYASARPDSIDALILDEAHRLRPFSYDRWTAAGRRSGVSQIEELIRAAKVSVFFIDDLQVVRPGEIGSSALIRDAANEQGVALQEFELEAQFRCNGSDGFINWVDNTLQIRRTAEGVAIREGAIKPHGNLATVGAMRRQKGRFSVEEDVRRLSEQLMPLLDRANRMLIRNLQAIKELRQGRVPAIARPGGAGDRYQRAERPCPAEWARLSGASPLR